MHFSENPESDMMMIVNTGSGDNGFGTAFTSVNSNMVNCGVYLFTVSEMYAEPVYKDYGEKYGRILAISKDDHQERSLSQL